MMMWITIVSAVSALFTGHATVRQDRQAPNPGQPTPRTALAAAAVGGNVYVFGGGKPVGGAPIESRVLRLDAHTMEWSEAGEWPAPRLFPAAAPADGKVYLVSGMTREVEYSPACEAFDPDTGAWQTLAPALIGCNRAAAAALDGAVYLVSGYAPGPGREGLNTPAVQRYDIKADTWSRIADIPVPRHGHCVVAAGGRIYVMGGYGPDWAALASVCSYEPGANAWRPEPPMTRERTFFGAAVIDGCIYAAGSRTEKGCTVEMFRPGDGAWSPLGDPLPARNRFGAAAVGERLFVIGGEADNEHGWPERFLEVLEGSVLGRRRR